MRAAGDPREGPRETEVKFRLSDRAAFEARLRELGAKRGATEDESNVLFDDDTMTLKNAGSALRIRTIGSTGLLTFKGKASFNAGIKSRVELETRVDEPNRLAAILLALGYSPRFTYEKRRTTWTFADASRPEVVVDETPIGLFAEIEGAEDSVRALAKELGVAEQSFIPQSYVALYQMARAKDPALPDDMVFRKEPT